MRWAVLSPGGRVTTLYSDEEHALLNSGGADVRPIGDQQAACPADWRFDQKADDWVSDPLPERDPSAGKTYAQRRRQEYDEQLDRDLQYEAFMEALAGLATPAARAAAPGAFDKLDLQLAKIAKIKALHPKKG